MRIIGWAILTGVASFALCGSAHALDCANPSVPAESVICSDQGLQKLFDQRREAYQAAKARSGEAEKKALADDRRHWLKSYQTSCGVAEKGSAPAPDKAVVACFSHAFKARIAWLRGYPPAAAPKPPDVTETAAKAAVVAAHSPAVVHREFTFACRTPEKLARVLRALAANDLAYPLNQPDCLPLVKGREAQVIAQQGTVAKIRLCIPEAGCTEVYAEAASIRDDGSAAGK
ncbi:MAG TPA: lysozyme inhibitor LprI family protein [Stellaceae bacterium]|nr:lysozyme inhibitor LprI family protein [Stellaceae bacterium]